MTPISLALLMLSPSPSIILLPNLLLWGCLFNPINVCLKFRLAYFLSSFLLLNYVAPFVALKSLVFCLSLFPPPFFYTIGSKWGCSTCRRILEVGDLGDFWYSLSMFHPYTFLFASLLPPPPPNFQNQHAVLLTPPLWEFLKGFWVWVHWNASRPLLLIGKWLSPTLVGA